MRSPTAFPAGFPGLQTTRTAPASGVVRDYALATLPVDVDGLARDLGLPIYLDASLPESISGKISRDGAATSGFRITVNANDVPHRRRFTIAHEIGHYVLHRDLILDEVTDNEMYRSSELSDEFERQANRFAADLLLPAQVVRDQYRKLPAIIPLARLFAVSEEAMRIRLKELRLGP
jgi:hypothetical protein